MGEIWVTADPHLDHANILKYCKRYQFMTPEEVEACKAAVDDRETQRKIHISRESVERMNSAFFNNTNRLISAGDSLYIIGDFLFAKNESVLSDMRSRINCSDVHFLMGDHDRFSIAQYRKYFQSVQRYRQIKIGNTYIILLHWPIMRWQKSHYGSYHVFGHCHTKANDWIYEHMPFARMKDIGVDGNDMKPYNLRSVLTELSVKPGYDVSSKEGNGARNH